MVAAAMKAGVHRVIIKLAKEGVSLEEIARQTSVPLAAVKNILASPMARAEVARCA
jgi:hypothetical protein